MPRTRGRLRSLTLRDNAEGTIGELEATRLFILIGFAPRTQWLPAEIARRARLRSHRS